MAILTGRLEKMGAFIEIVVMATHPRVTLLKKSGIPVPPPMALRTLIDTGASSSILDPNIVGQLNLEQTGTVLIHTPSTGSDYQIRDQFDVCFILGDPSHSPRSFTVGAISSHLASEGFYAVIGWDILRNCILTCDGPAGRFKLEF